MTKVLTIGTFDTPHIGHASLFKRASEYGELVVGVNSDEFVERYKNCSPLYNFDERAKLIRSFGYEVAKNESAGRELINQVQPDLIVIGSDWLRKNYLEQIDVTDDYLDLNEISLMYIPYTQGISSTDIKRRCEGRNSSNDQ